MSSFYALIIGIDDYHSSEISNLDKAKKDAEDIYTFLTTSGGYKKENTVLLTNKEVTKENIISQITELEKRFVEDSTLIIYISGHGGNINNEYILPLYSFKKKIKNTYFNEKELIDLFSKISVNKLLFLLDSCHAGILAKEKKLNTGMTENLLDKLVSTFPIDNSRVLLASSLPNQSSWECANIDNGIFTYCLLKALKGACLSERHSEILVIDLLKYLVKNVPYIAKQCGVVQNCCVKTSVLYQDFPICLTSGEMDYAIQLPNRFINAVVDLEEDQNALMKKYASCLNDRKVDSKFAYWGEEVTKKYIELLNTEEYTLPNMTRKLLSDNIDNILSDMDIETKSIRVISLGIGDGLKDSVIINKIFEITNAPIDYWIIEISYEMIKIGLNNVREHLNKENQARLNPRLFQTDFLDIDILTDLITDDKTNLFLLLGNTLGNFPEDILLNKISSVMRKNDYFLIDNQIKGENKINSRERAELISMYNTEKYKEYIMTILKNAKIDETDGKIVTRVESYEDANILTLRSYKCVSVIQEFQFTRTKNVEIAGKAVIFDKDSILPVIYSRKYTKKALNSLLKSYFKVVNEPYYLNNKYALILLQKQ